MNKEKKHITSFSLYKTAPKKLFHSIWLFPLLFFIVVVGLTALRVSGSSIGVYSIIDGIYDKDTNVVWAGPRGVRSDEWLVNTQMVVAQANNNFKRINDNIGNGQDMSLIYDAPYKEWSALFKPQNFSFFVIPLEYAFAFKWWLLIFILVMSCYFLMLELSARKILRSVLVALFVGFTPMVFWWYQSATILPLAYSFLIILFALRLLKTESTKARFGHSLVISYLLICFALILYPPFQIPCLIGVGVFILGWILENYLGQQKLKKLFLDLWPWALFIIVVVLSIGILFYSTRKDVIHTIGNTVYPGSRIITSGGPSPLLTFSSFLSPNLQYDNKAATGYLGNQSEASNFVFIAPYLLLPSLYLIFQERKRRKKISWGLLLINILLVFFLIRMYVISPPWVEPIYRLFLLDKVPNTRLLLGLGFVGILQLILFMKALGKIPLKKLEGWALAIAGSLSGLAVMIFVGSYTIDHFPVFITSFAKMLVFSTWVSLGIFMLLRKYFIAGLVILIAFSLLSIYKINPLYRGLSPLTKTPIVQAIQKYPDKGSWVVLDDRLMINFPLMTGRSSINSVQFYPQLSLWRQIDKSKKYEEVYNRYAHIVFVDDKQMAEPFILKYADNFLVKFEPCKDFLQTRAKYVLSPKILPLDCLTFQKQIDSPTRHLYIYEIK